MAQHKVVFVAFAIDDETQRDLLKGQSLNTITPFKYIDISLKDTYSCSWSERVRTRSRRSDRVIALVSKNSQHSNGQRCEIACAREQKRPALGIWAYEGDRNDLPAARSLAWT